MKPWPDPSRKCQECLRANCRTCQKIERMDPMGSAVLDEMRENIEETVLPDNRIKYSIKYVTYKNLKYTFPPDLSNYNEALMQSKNNFKKLIKVKGRLEAIQEMMTRGQTDHHFRILDANETKTILSQPHCI